jgi:type II secretory pathway component PulF
MALDHKKLAFWYLQLAQNLDGGVVLATALVATRGPPAEDLAKMARWIEGGGSIAQAFDLAKGWISDSERPFLVAAATSGRLPMALRRLSERHLALRKGKYKLAMECAYPALVFNFALIVLPIVQLTGGLTLKGYLGKLALVAVPVWLLEAAAAVLVAQKNPLALQVLDRLPLIGRFRKAQELSDFTVTLGNLLEAGVIIGDAWMIASQASQSPALRQAGREIRETILKGEPPGLQLQRFPCFPNEYAGLYRTGEISGQLDQNLRLLATQSQESADRMLKVSMRIYTGIVFGIVVAIVFWMALSFWTGYWGQFKGLLPGM